MNLDRQAATSGFAFVALFVAGVIPLGELLGSFADSDSTFEVYFDDAANRVGAIAGGLLLGISAFVFLWFIHRLERRLQSGTAEGTILPAFMGSCAKVFVSLLLVGTALLITVPFTLAFAGLTDDQPFGVGQSVAPQAGYVVLALYANWAAAVTVVGATISARRSGVFPRWLCRLGWVIAALLIVGGGTGGGAFFALPAWVLAVSIQWFRKSRL